MVMHGTGRLEIIVDGERWTPTPDLAGCGPEDRCYVLRVDDDGTGRLVFGDGTNGSRLPTGARVAARYRYGSGASGNADDARASDFAVVLIELLAEMGDVLSFYQDQVASEAYLETSRERRSLRDASDLRSAIADSHGAFEVCLCLRPLSQARS
jgi:hypothetical protein